MKKVVKNEVLLILTDTHLNESNIELNISIWTQAIDTAAKYKIPVFHAGDIFHNRKRSGQSLSVLTAFIRILNYAEEKEVMIYAIPGNHDKIDLDSEDSYLDVFSTHRAFTVYSAGQILPLSNMNVYILPYFKEDGQYPIRLKTLHDVVESTTVSKERPNILITHVGVNGVRNNDGSKVANEITDSVFTPFDKVLVGHYHNRSTVGSKIHYIGSAMAHNFGEDNEKGFVLLSSDGSFKYIQSTFPKYLTYEIQTADPESYQETINTIVNTSSEKDNIRTLIVGDREDLVAFNKEELEEAGAKVVLKSTESAGHIEAAINDEFVSYDGGNIMTAFDQYCEGVEISKKLSKLGKEELQKIF